MRRDVCSCASWTAIENSGPIIAASCAALHVHQKRADAAARIGIVDAGLLAGGAARHFEQQLNRADAERWLVKAHGGAHGHARARAVCLVEVGYLELGAVGI